MRIRRSDTDVEMLNAIMATKAAKERVAEADESYRKAQHALVELIRSRDQKSATVTIGDEKVRATVVQKDRVTIDEPHLRKALGASLFDALCTKKIDRNLLKAAVSDGSVDPVVVAQHSTITKESAYVVFSTPKEPE